MTNQTTNQQKNILTIPIAIIIAGLIIAGAIVYTQRSGGTPEREVTNQAPSAREQAEVPVSSDAHIRGNKNAEITIVEFSDFQCPFCQRFHPTLQQILLDFSGDIRWVYKHFPLDSIHAQARPAAEASECAWEQKGNDGFWEFADGLFENQSRLGKSLYTELAQDSGLDIDKFESCVSSRKYKDKVEVDYQEGIKLGVRGTPGSFLNGQVVPGAVPYEQLKSTVEQTLSNL